MEVLTLTIHLRTHTRRCHLRPPARPHSGSTGLDPARPTGPACWSCSPRGLRLPDPRDLRGIRHPAGVLLAVGIDPATSVGSSAVPPAAVASGSTRISDSDLTQSTTWDLSGSPYVITGRLRVMSGVVLRVMPGTVVKFMPLPGQSYNTSQLLVYGGQLVANGTAANPVVFTSGYDDTYGGDSNGDDSALIRKLVVGLGGSGVAEP